ncbi:gamma-glutamyltransferase [Alkalilimnicola sp. S0819]|uniref:gamma-glutamyltransferase n=1 Tax=Alkalilimnicola sp. S0819 TaxID=2613922 RepID=UPI00126210A2|nr:gamma-glutamyltransferase [Alkalilimnicola sp. S0819]KAB7627359.1 gamma-glutamyltransferase [Alkalilimnicola sp. S0819]MPQ16077.1 gamma-glutamyltransferase [Alkalilimnicola sp. S0819]
MAMRPARLLLLLLLFLADPALAERGPQAAIASAHPLATSAGREILEAGGNAFDAAVAVSATLAVVEPYGSGLGGGGFWLLHRAKDGRDVMLDGRERAPLAAHAALYQDAEGQVLPKASLHGPLAAAIPGTPAALAHLAEHYGRLPLARSLRPAIHLARAGFPVDAHFLQMLHWRRDALNEEARRLLLDQGALPAPGWRLRQPELAQTLERLAAQGHDGFYRGPIARDLVAEVRAAGGIWRLQDLREYRVVEREPVRGRYHGIEVISAPPPSAGGVGLIGMLNILEHYDLSTLEPTQRIHLIVEAMRRAYRDRAEYLGDPDHVAMPLARLLSKDYAAGLAQGIHPRRATPSELLAPVNPQRPGGEDTTHFSIIDADGNRVAATLSINYPFGSGFMAPGTGILLNNEMDDFAAAVGKANAYGLVGTAPNTIAPGKRPLSSMTPTFLVDGERVAVLGTPGGSRIITMVLLGALSFADGEEPTRWVSLPRYHHQYLPDHIQFEPGALPEAVRDQLRAMGHALKARQRRYGDMQAVRRDGDGLKAAADPRGVGQAQVFAPAPSR